MRALLAFLLFIPSLCLSVEIKPLTEITQQRDMMDKTTYLYLGERCAGLFLTSYKAVNESNKEVADTLLLKASVLISVSKLFHNSYGKIDDEEIIKKIGDSALKFNEIYSDLFEKNWIEKGAYFEGTFIENDVAYCNSFYEEIKIAANKK